MGTKIHFLSSISYLTYAVQWMVMHISPRLLVLEVVKSIRDVSSMPCHLVIPVHPVSSIHHRILPITSEFLYHVHENHPINKSVKYFSSVVDQILSRLGGYERLCDCPLPSYRLGHCIIDLQNVLHKFSLTWSSSIGHAYIRIY